eukprot:TRINITY_DN1101_c0_g1_i3.p1 TRINITY_DN1101_c0_g1~~TRINITY_DN1101_c0_g1_i3.p1  ORF type:complete len:323 (-),score=45.04 TRINITY_DN1101_c0_g1_i3:201-1169(-)
MRCALQNKYIGSVTLARVFATSPQRYFATTARSRVVRFEALSKKLPLCCTTDLTSRPSANCGSDADVESASGALVADVRYEASQRLLLVGEANFTFASSLASRLGDCSLLTATSFESRDELLSVYGDGLAKRIAALESRLCGVHHKVSANGLISRFREASFDCVVFNFPLSSDAAHDESAGKSVLTSDDSCLSDDARLNEHAGRLRRTYENLAVILTDFFDGAAYLLPPGGECHVRLTDQFATSIGLRAAHSRGLHLVSRIDFGSSFEKVYKRLGYKPSAVQTSRGRGAGPSRRSISRRGFDVRHSSTFVFRRGLPSSIGTL